MTAGLREQEINVTQLWSGILKLLPLVDKQHLFAQNLRIRLEMRLICENIWTPCHKFA